MTNKLEMGKPPKVSPEQRLAEIIEDYVFHDYSEMDSGLEVATTLAEKILKELDVEFKKLK